MSLKSKKIAIFLPSLSGGGAERVMINLSHGFINQGHKIDLVLANASGPYMTELDERIDVHDLKKTSVTSAVPSLINYLRTYKPDYMISSLMHANLSAITAKYLANTHTKLFIREANVIDTGLNYNSRIKQRLMLILARHLYHLTSHVIAVSDGVADDLHNLFKISKKKITVINNPVYINEHEKNKHVDHKWLYDDGHPVLLGVGRLEKQKNFILLLRAFSIIHKNRKCRLIILGEGSEKSLLQELAKEMEIDKYVDFPGFNSNPFAFMRRAAVFVLSSSYEGFPNVLIQAMACGCPVVSTDCKSGPRDILQDGKFGELVPVDDPIAMARAIDKVLNAQIDKNILIERSRDYNLDEITKMYLKVML